MNRLTLTFFILLIIITASIPIAYPATYSQMVINTGFESGLGSDAYNWTEYAPAVGSYAGGTVNDAFSGRVASTAIAGSYVAELRLNITDDANLLGSFLQIVYVEQEFSSQELLLKNYSVKYVVNENSGGGALYIKFYSNTTLVYQNSVQIGTPGTTIYTVSEELQSNNYYITKIRIELQVIANNGSTDVVSLYIDEVYVYTVDETPSYFDNQNLNLNGKFFDPSDNYTYQATLKEKGTGNTVSNQPTYLNLKRYTPSKVVDLSGNGNDGSVYGGAEVVGSPYDDGMAMKFDGVDDEVKVLDNSLLDMAGGNTISLEVMTKVLAIPSSGVKVLAGKDFTGYQLLLHSDGRFSFSVRNGTSTVWDRAYSTTIAQVGKWYHIIGIYDGSNVYIYINATLDGNATSNIVFSDEASDYWVGGWATSGPEINAIISLNRLYNRSLSASEVQQNYYSVVFGNVSYVSSGLVLYFEFGEFQESTWTDISGNGNNGTAYNGLVNKIDRDTGRWVWQFDESDKYIQIADSNSLDVNQFTFITFIKTDLQFSNLYGGLWFDQYTFVRNRIMVKNTGEILVQYDVNGTDMSLLSSSIVQANKWIMIVVQYDGSQFRVYGNLTLAGTYNITGPISISASPRIVGKGYSNTYFFKGSIASVYLYNKSLSTTELNQMLNAFFYGNTSIVWDGLVLYLDASYLNGNVVASYTQNTDASGVVSYSITLPSEYGPYMAHIISNQTWIAEDWRWIYIYKMQLTEYGVADNRVDLGSTVSISGKLRHPLLGFIDSTIYINSTAVTVSNGQFTYNVTQSSVGKWRYQITGVSYDNIDTYYGVADYIDIIWDALQISVSQAISGDGYITYTVSIVHVYDNAVPSSYTVWINGSTYLNQNQITLPLSGTVRMFKAVSGDYGITYSYNTVNMYLNPVSEPQGSTFYIIKSDGLEITNRSWDDNNKDLLFTVSGDVMVYVGDWLGNFKQVIVDGNIYTDYSVNNNYRTIYINNLASQVKVDFEVVEGGGPSSSESPGGPTSTPSQSTPSSPSSPAVSPGPPRLPVTEGVVVLVVVVAAVFSYRYVKRLEKGERLRRRFSRAKKDLTKKWRKRLGVD